MMTKQELEDFRKRGEVIVAIKRNGTAHLAHVLSTEWNLYSGEMNARVRFVHDNADVVSYKLCFSSPASWRQSEFERIEKRAEELTEELAQLKKENV